MPDNPMQKGDELDILLDAALATYIDSEPSPGLTRRILAVTKDLDCRASVRWLHWAVPTLAALLLGISDVAGKYYVPKMGPFVIYTVMIVILIWRPNGLFGRTAAR